MQSRAATTPDLYKLSEQVRTLSRSDQLWLIEQIIWWLRTASPAPTTDSKAQPTELWDEDELRTMLNAIEPMTSKAIVEAGLVGSWADESTGDGADWVEEQRAKTRDRYPW